MFWGGGGGLVVDTATSCFMDLLLLFATRLAN